MELRQQLGVLRSWAWLIVVSVLLAGAAAFLVSNALPKVYEGKATLVVGQGTQATNPDYNQLLASQRLSQTYAKLATAGPLLQKVIDKNGLGITPDEFEKRIVAQAPTDSNLVYLTVQDGDPTRAATLANSLANEMVADSPAVAGRDSQVQQFIDTDLAAIQAQIQDTQAEIQRLTSLPSRSADDEQQLQALQGRIVTLQQTYATMLGFSSSSGANLLTVSDPARVPPTRPRRGSCSTRSSRRSSGCSSPSASPSCSSTSTTPSSHPTTWRRWPGCRRSARSPRCGAARSGARSTGWPRSSIRGRRSPRRIGACAPTSSSPPSTRRFGPFS